MAVKHDFYAEPFEFLRSVALCLRQRNRGDLLSFV